MSNFIGLFWLLAIQGRRKSVQKKSIGTYILQVHYVPNQEQLEAGIGVLKDNKLIEVSQLFEGIAVDFVIK